MSARAGFAIAIALLLPCLAPPPAQAAAIYKFVDLGLLRSEDGVSNARDISEDGQIVGVSGSLTVERAVLWKSGAVVDLGALPGEATSLAVGINATGQIVGSARHDNDDTNSRAFHAAIWNDRVIAPLAEPDAATESAALAINDAGQVVGFVGTPESSQAALWQDTEITLLSPEPSVARDINNAGQIVGTVERSAVRWEADSGAVLMLGDLPGGQRFSSANAINEAGQIVGQSDSADGVRAILWTKGIMIDLGVLPGTSESAALDINGLAQVVGESRDNEGRSSAFLWSAGEMFDLNQLVTNLVGWQLIRAHAINDQGWIVGQALAPDGSAFHAFLLMPVPEGGAAWLLALGAAALFIRRQVRTRHPAADASF